MLSSLNKIVFFALIHFYASGNVNGQTIKLDENGPQKQFPYISMVFNRVFNSGGLDSFYQKLSHLKKSKKGTISIVHIGDSHVESGYYPASVKKGFQDFFGDPGIFKKDSSGVLYSAIGINGARYETFIQSATFWEQLPGLQADLIIISLGTNDAQANEFNEKDFHQQVSLLMDKIKKIVPAAAILFTTAADSFKGRYPNRELWNMNVSLFSYCSANNIPIWDLYRTTNGYGSAYNWIKKGMMSADGIHFTAKGYQLQGQLLFNALAKGYNNYVNSY